MSFNPADFHILNFSQPIFTADGDNHYQLTQPYIVSWEYQGLTYRINVPSGDETDGASVPQFAWSLGFIPVGLDMAAAAVHDILYCYQGAMPAGYFQVHKGEWINVPTVWTRGQCDALFKLLLNVSGYNKFKAEVMYLAVRAFGWAAWRRWMKTG